jgi:hypothetical protein
MAVQGCDRLSATAGRLSHGLPDGFLNGLRLLFVAILLPRPKEAA